MVSETNIRRIPRENLDHSFTRTPKMRPESSSLEIGLNAAIVAVLDNEPVVLVVRGEAGTGLQQDSLPSGPFTPVEHRTLEGGLRSWVAEQAGIDLGYVEQLYSFGDRGRHAQPGDEAPHVVSIGYLALTDAAKIEEAQRSSWRSWYFYFPWEDWRKGRPQVLETEIEPRLRNGLPVPMKASIQPAPWHARIASASVLASMVRPGTKKRFSTAMSCCSKQGLSKRPAATAARPLSSGRRIPASAP
jgi:hypothetical protein